MTLYFITGNSNKLEEVRAILLPRQIENLKIPLTEIQELDPHKIIEHKLQEARKQHQGMLFCEDTSVYLDCLNGYPGPLIKWFMDSLKIQGIADLVSKYDDQKATARTIIGLFDGENIHYFEGELQGTIVQPRGPDTFGWDPIFQPNGYSKTMAEMTKEEKNQISMRQKALEKMKNYLDGFKPE